ncbi:MAG: ABC transporter permease [Microlunatus sp.]|nr:ABC transporter permease [Microlunatus sp.]
MYVARRLLNYAILLFVAISLSYLLAATQLNPRALYEVQNPPLDPVAIEASLREKNLSDNVPLLQRYWTWLTDIVLHWDWGQGPRGGDVNAEVSRRIWVSLRLITIGSLVGIVTGVVIGAWTATRQYKPSDRFFTASSLFLLSVPSFVIASVLQVWATDLNDATGIRFFEFVGETGAVGSYPAAWLVDRLQHLLLPTIVLILLNAAFFSRIQRNLMLDSLGADYVRTARAKGLRRAKAVMKHALRTSLIPTGTYFAFSVATLFTGATFMEIIFSFHGMGEYGVTTILGQDVNGAVAVAAFSGVCVLVGAVLADIMVAILDPRVRLG